jgi:hypothetical protein
LKNINKEDDSSDENEAVAKEISEAVRQLEPNQKQMIRMLILGYIAGHNQKPQKVSETA